MKTRSRWAPCPLPTGHCPCLPLSITLTHSVSRIIPPNRFSALRLSVVCPDCPDFIEARRSGSEHETKNYAIVNRRVAGVNLVLHSRICQCPGEQQHQQRGNEDERQRSKARRHERRPRNKAWSSGTRGQAFWQTQRACRQTLRTGHQEGCQARNLISHCGHQLRSLVSSRRAETRGRRSLPDEMLIAD